MATNERKTSRSGQETRDRIIDAALETVRVEGLVGTSVRAIARTGDFNQALVFYHFGSVDDLLLTALERANDRRIERFRDQLSEVETLPDLVRVAVDLHNNNDDVDQPALVAIVSGWPTSSDAGKRVLATLRKWDELVESAVQRIVAGTPLAQVVPTKDVGHAISALFLGIGLMGKLDPEERRDESLLNSMTLAAQLASPFLESMRANVSAGTET